MSLSRTLAIGAFTVFAAAPIAAQPAATSVPPVSAAQTEPAAIPAPVPIAESVPSLAPTAVNATVGIRLTDVALTDAPVTLPRRSDRQNSPALMIVGGAALIVGAIIGGTPGTIVMIGGAAVGLYGLYHYLQ